MRDPSNERPYIAPRVVKLEGGRFARGSCDRGSGELVCESGNLAAVGCLSGASAEDWCNFGSGGLIPTSEGVPGSTG